MNEKSDPWPIDQDEPDSRLGECPRDFEALAARLVAVGWLGEAGQPTLSRTRDAIELSFGDAMEPSGEGGVILLLTPESVEIRLPSITWTRGAYGPVASSRFWRRVSIRPLIGAVGPGGSDVRLRRLVDSGLRARRAEMRSCHFCGERFGPERMSDDACHGCASEHRGVVY